MQCASKTHRRRAGLLDRTVWATTLCCFSPSSSSNMIFQQQSLLGHCWARICGLGSWNLNHMLACGMGTSSQVCQRLRPNLIWCLMLKLSRGPIGAASTLLGWDTSHQGTAAVFPHASEPTVCQVCWGTSSTQPWWVEPACPLWQLAWFIQTLPMRWNKNPQPTVTRGTTDTLQQLRMSHQ